MFISKIIILYFSVQELGEYLKGYSTHFSSILAFKPTGWTTTAKCNSLSNIRPVVRGVVTVYGELGVGFEVGVVTMYSDVGVVTDVEFGPIITLEVCAVTHVVLKNCRIAVVLVIIHALWPVTGYSSYFM